MKFKILSDYEAAKHNDHWYNASSTLVMLDVSKDSYKFHCFMTFHSEQFNYSESFDTMCMIIDGFIKSFKMQYNFQHFLTYSLN